MQLKLLLNLLKIINFSSCSNLEKTVEENFKQRYTLIDRTDAAAIAAAQKVCLILSKVAGKTISL